MPNAAHAVYHANIVRRKAEHRAIIRAATATLQEAYNETGEPSQIRQRLIETIDGAADRGHRHQTKTAGEAAQASVEQIKERKAKGKPIGLYTGFLDFDDSTGGLHDGELTILAARPGMGKTSAALQIAVEQAKRENSVLFVSMEMSAAELMTRVLCTSTKVDHALIRSNTISDDEIASLESAATKLQASNLHIIDPPSMTVADVRTAARRLRKRHGLSLVVVDYLTRLTPASTRIKRYEQVGQMSGDLKRLARELNLPVLVLAQLNRQAESQGNTRPQLSHLRDSGDIEQDSDVVLFLHRPEVYKPDDGDLKGKAELIVAKNRNGPVGNFKLHWLPETTEFRTPAPKHCDWHQAAEASADRNGGFDA